MKLGIIILSWNSEDRIINCLDSIFKFYKNPNIYVVDNNSKDRSVDLIKKHYPEINLILSNSNLGFSAGNNLGFVHALKDGCDYVLLLNDDVIVLEDFISPLIVEMENDKTIGSIGPVVVENYDRNIIQSAGGKINLITLDMDYLKRGENYKKINKVKEVGYVLGAAVFVRTSLFKKSFLFDPHFYPAYVEEVDMCYRIKKMGYTNKVSYNYKIAHIGSLSASNSSITYRRILNNKFLFAIKHLSVINIFFSVNFLLSKFFIKILLKKINRNL